MHRERIVVFTGAGSSAESGLQTFRDAGGLWHGHSVYDVATPEAFARDPAKVLAFYNERRRAAATVKPNPAHYAIARLEEAFDVCVITQNVDDLHERGGSTDVVHLHGKLNEARGSGDSYQVRHIGDKPIHVGDRCELGTQLRPNIVWFGEAVRHIDRAVRHIRQADRLLVIGTSLTVFPAAGLLEEARNALMRIIVTLDLDQAPEGFLWLRGKAAELVPPLVQEWLDSGPGCQPSD